MANPRCYAIDAAAAIASPTVSALGITTTTAIRPEIFDMLLGSSATPADNAITWKVQRFTANGTNSAVTPTPLDTGDPAATATGQKTFTIEPTYTANLILFHLALNQRASHRWNADPQGRLKLNATASNGVGLYPVHASATVTMDSHLWFNE